MNILLIGLGQHAKRIYLPYLLRRNIKITAIVEVDSNIESTRTYLDKQGLNHINIISSTPFSSGTLPDDVATTLNQIEKLDAVIIATEPLIHMAYARWAVSRNINVLLDKPISTYINIANDPDLASRLVDDYQELDAAYRNNPVKTITIATQRRYHSGFQKVHELIDEIAERFNCPVSSIDAHHADGQWRLPEEIETIDYHGFKEGNGKLSHSGYHILDALTQMIEWSYIKSGMRVSDLEISAYFARPGYLVDQMDYDNIFNDSVSTRSPSVATLSSYGEHDVSLSGAISRNGIRSTLFNVSLLHNSLSDRHWLHSRKNLYKKNGRIKHEFYNITQGPFQNIQIHSFQSKSEHDDAKTNDNVVSGNSHFEIHIFRNTALSGGESYQVLNFGTTYQDDLNLVSEYSKYKMCDEFIAFCNGEIQKGQLMSDVSSHYMSVAMLSLAYKSGALDGDKVVATLGASNDG